MNFENFYGGLGRPYWLPYGQLRQPPVLVIHVPVTARTPFRDQQPTFNRDDRKHFVKTKSKSTRTRDFKRRQTFLESKTICSGLPFFELDNLELQQETASNTVFQERKAYSKSKPEERKAVCSLLPGADLSDKQFCKLFSRLDDRQTVVNNALIRSLELSDTRISELQRELEKVNSVQCALQQRHSTEMEQTMETLNCYKFDAELCRLKIADLEERNRQLKESFNLVNSACGKLIDDKTKLSNAVRQCFENLKAYKDVNNQTNSEELNCEWCSIVGAFYRVCLPE